MEKEKDLSTALDADKSNEREVDLKIREALDRVGVQTDALAKKAVEEISSIATSEINKVLGKPDEISPLMRTNPNRNNSTKNDLETEVVISNKEDEVSISNKTVGTENNSSQSELNKIEDEENIERMTQIESEKVAVANNATTEEGEPERIKELRKKAAEASAERAERAAKIAEKFKVESDERINRKAAEKGFNVLEKARKMGDWYKNIKPDSAKIALGIALTAGGIASAMSGAALASALFGSAIAIKRVVAGAATFVAVERYLNKTTESHMKEKGGEITKAQKIRHTIEATVLAALVGGSGAIFADHTEVAGGVDSNPEHKPEIKLPNETPKLDIEAQTKAAQDYMNATDDATREAIKKASGLTDVQLITLAPAEAETIQTVENIEGASEAVTGIAGENEAQSVVESHTLGSYEVKNGDNMYTIIKDKFPEIANLEGGRQTNAIENILAELKNNGEDVDSLNIGDEIDLDVIKEIIETKEIRGEGLIDHANNLDGATVEKIEAYKPEVEESETPEVVVQKETNETQVATDTPSETQMQAQESSVATPEQIGEIAGQLYVSKINEFFSTPKFLWWGGSEGINSSEWASIKDVSATEASATTDNGNAISRAHKFIDNISQISNIKPEPGETIDGYAQRAIAELTVNKLN